MPASSSMAQKSNNFCSSSSMPRRIFAVSGSVVRFLAAATMQQTSGAVHHPDAPAELADRKKPDSPCSDQSHPPSVYEEHRLPGHILVHRDQEFDRKGFFNGGPDNVRRKPGLSLGSFLAPSHFRG